MQHIVGMCTVETLQIFHELFCVQTIPPGVYRENRTYQLRQIRSAGAKEDKPSLWKMPKFLNAVCFVFV